MLRLAAAAITAIALIAAPSASAITPARADRALDAALERLVAAEGGPPGAISVVQRGRSREVHRAGVGDVETGAKARVGQHMRIASVAKTFVGATALSLVQDGRMSLDDTIGERLSGMPGAWSQVTLGQMLNHTSGLPDYSTAKAFQTWLVKNLHGTISPRALIGFVEGEPLQFTPGSAYEYSNTDNVMAGLMVEAASGRSYESELRDRVLTPLALRQTSLPSGWRMPTPFIHGYEVEPPKPPEDISQIVSMSSLWAAGGIVSTPADLNRFIRGYVGRRLFGRAVQDRQFAFVKGESQPPGPGRNSAGMSIFRYRTKCGTLYGHTGNIFGYTQFVAATADGARSVTVSATTQLARGVGSKRGLRALRRAFEAAACAALAR